jgi:hypothetical protein
MSPILVLHLGLSFVSILFFWIRSNWNLRRAFLTCRLDWIALVVFAPLVELHHEWIQIGFLCLGLAVVLSSVATPRAGAAIEKIFFATGCLVSFGLLGDEFGQAGAVLGILAWHLARTLLLDLADDVGENDRIILYRGFGARNARAPGYFVATSFLALGIPGGLGFVAEDLLVHDAVHLGMGVGILALAINGIAAYSAFRIQARLYGGPVPRADTYYRTESSGIAFLRKAVITGMIFGGLFSSYWIHWFISEVGGGH